MADRGWHGYDRANEQERLRDVLPDDTVTLPREVMALAEEWAGCHPIDGGVYLCKLNSRPEEVCRRCALDAALQKAVK